MNESLLFYSTGESPTEHTMYKESKEFDKVAQRGSLTYRTDKPSPQRQKSLSKSPIDSPKSLRSPKLSATAIKHSETTPKRSSNLRSSKNNPEHSVSRLSDKDSPRNSQTPDGEKYPLFDGHKLKVFEGHKLQSFDKDKYGFKDSKTTKDKASNSTNKTCLMANPSASALLTIKSL